MRGCCWPAHKKRLKLIKDFTLCMSYTQYSFTEHLNFCKMCLKQDFVWFTVFIFRLCTASSDSIFWSCSLYEQCQLFNNIVFSGQAVVKQPQGSYELPESHQEVVRWSSTSPQIIIYHFFLKPIGRQAFSVLFLMSSLQHIFFLPILQK